MMKGSSDESVYCGKSVFAAIILAITLSLIIISPVALSVDALVSSSHIKKIEHNLKTHDSKPSDKREESSTSHAFHRSSSSESKISGSSNIGGNMGCPPGGCPPPGGPAGGGVGGAGGGPAPSSEGTVLDFSAPIVKASSNSGSQPLSNSGSQPLRSGGGTTTRSTTTTTTAGTSSVNSPPTVESFVVIIHQPQPVVITLRGSDPNGKDTLTYFILSPPMKGTLSRVTGASVTYTPGPNLANTGDSFSYKTTDSAGLSSNIGIVTIKINGVVGTH